MVCRSLLRAKIFPAKETTTMRLISLPPEIQRAIFKYLGPVSSTCLGLTCTAFYRIYWSIHRKVRLWEADDPSEKAFVVQDLLGWQLRGWVYPMVLHWHNRTAMFVTNKQLVACEEWTGQEAPRSLRKQRRLAGFCKKFKRDISQTPLCFGDRTGRK